MCLILKLAEELISITNADGGAQPKKFKILWYRIYDRNFLCGLMNKIRTVFRFAICFGLLDIAYLFDIF